MLGIIFGIILAVPTTFAQELPPISLETTEKKIHNMDSRLVSLYESTVKEDMITSLDSAHTMSSDEQRVQVVLKMINVNAPIPENLGINVEVSYEDLVQANIPTRNLERVAADENVLTVMMPSHPQPTNHVTSEGARAIFSNVVNESGYTGKGVKVAVIDTGFNINNSEIAGNIAEYRSFSNAYRITGSDSDHGTAVAEIIVDVAPDVELYLYNIDTNIEFYNLIDYIIERGDIDIITMSLGWYNDVGPADGTSRLAQKVNETRNNGILFITSAGNEAERHWQGRFSDPDNDYIHNFRSNDETIVVNARAGDTLVVYLSWWDSPSEDYDLYLFDIFLGEIYLLDRSENIQPRFNPVEVIAYTFRYDTTARIVISGLYAENPVNFELFSSSHRLAQYQVTRSSITIPADAKGSFSVGATNFSNGTLEYYSSHGPTLDGRTKPDITGPARVSTTAYGYQDFYGTSAAAPHVAGAAALIMEKWPSVTADHVQTILESTTYNHHTKSNRDGTGRLSVSMLAQDVILALDNSNPNCDPCFYPENINVNPGDDVTWFNTINSPISITGGLGENSFTINDFERGDLRSNTFNYNGIVEYYDALHPWATGQIIVGTPNPPTLLYAVITEPNKISMQFSEPVTLTHSNFSSLNVMPGGNRNVTSVSGSGTDIISIFFDGSPVPTDATGIIDMDSGIVNTVGTPLEDITNQPIIDGQSPNITHAILTEPNTIAITFSESVIASIVDFTDLSIMPGGNRNVTSVSGSGTNTISIFFDGSPTPTDATGIITTGETITDLVGNGVVSKSQIISDAQRPTITSAGITSSNTVTVSFSEPVNATSGNYAFVVTGESNPRDISGILGTRTNTISLVISGPTLSSDTTGIINIGMISDLAGNDMVPVDGYVSDDFQPPTITSAGITSPNVITISFSEPVNATLSDFANFTIHGESTARIFTDMMGNGTDVITLMISGSVIPSDATGRMDIGMISDIAGNYFVPVNNHMVNANQPPTITSAGITSPNVITISFSEPVNATLSDFANFTIHGESTARIFTDMMGSGTDVITLIISGSGTPSDATGTIDIAMISDLAGNDIIPVDGYVVGDFQPPTLLNISISSNNIDSGSAILGDIITISFTSSEEITDVSVRINKTDVIATSQDNISWTATHTITDADPVNTDVEFVIRYTDTSSNQGSFVTLTTDDSTVMVLSPETTITGTVFSDINWDGIQDAGEPGYAGYTMYATDKITGIQTLDITESDGTYSFDVIPNNETIVQTHFYPQGHTVYDVRTSWYKSVTIPKGQTISFDVGFHPITPEEQVTLNLIMYEDDNYNGIKDAGERTVSNLDDFYIYTYTIGPVAYPMPDGTGSVSVNDLVPADFAVLVNVESLADAGYVWATTSYELHDDSTEYILVAPVINAPEPGSEYTMMVGLG